jgi:hypothetical protein
LLQVICQKIEQLPCQRDGRRLSGSSDRLLKKKFPQTAEKLGGLAQILTCRFSVSRRARRPRQGRASRERDAGHFAEKANPRPRLLRFLLFRRLYRSREIDLFQEMSMYRGASIEVHAPPAGR